MGGFGDIRRVADRRDDRIACARQRAAHALHSRIRDMRIDHLLQRIPISRRSRTANLGWCASRMLLRRENTPTCFRELDCLLDRQSHEADKVVLQSAFPFEGVEGAS